MDREEDRTFEEHGKAEHDASFVEDVDMDAGRGDRDAADVAIQLGPDLIMDERLTSAAAPFLYMLSAILIAVAGYFVYLFFYG